jgi:spermidine/putrescine transport system substrate-binding protein
MDPRREFIQQVWRYKNGSISRRQFLGVTGLGVATAVLAQAMPELAGIKTAFAGSIGDKVSLATWPNYHDPKNFDKFKELTGAEVEVSVFGANEEFLAKLQAGGTGWDLFVPTNYTISTHASLGLIEPLDLAKVPNYDIKAQDARQIAEGTVDGVVYAAAKDWGTTGFAVNTDKIKENPTTWKEFWDLTRGAYSGRVTVHDYQLTTIGNALKYFGYSFNSIDPKELADAEKLLIEAKPHLFAITSDYQPAFRNGDAWLGICWTGDGAQLHRDIPAIQYVLGREGGEIWTDFYAIPKSAPNREGGYALLNFLLDPAVNADEAKFHGYATTDERVRQLLPKEVLDDPIIYPAAELLKPLEFGAAATFTNPARAEILARFKAA